MGWLLRNILFALVLPKALRISSDFILAFSLRIGLTQSGLLPLVASSSQLPNSKPLKNICYADVFAFLYLSAKSSELVSRLCTKKPALFVRAL
jgi:hypothetical protein